MGSESRAPLGRAAVCLATAATIAVAIWLRTAKLFVTPFWVDEAYSSYNAGHGFGFIWNVVPLYDSHPPFYYSLLRIWSLVFGDSLLSYRLVGLLCGLGAVAVVVLAAAEVARATGRREYFPRIAAGALAACAPLLIEQSREVRPYALMILAYAIALFAIARIARELAETSTFTTGTFVLFLGAMEAMLWLHNVGPLFAFALVIALWIVVKPVLARASDRKRIAAGFAIAAAAYIPCLVILVREMSSWSHTTAIRFRWSGLQWKLAYIFGAVSVVAIFAALVLAAVGIVELSRRRGTAIASAFLVAAIVPAALSIAVSVFLSPVFLVRTLTPLAVPVILLLASAMSAAGVSRWVASAALAVLLVQNIAFDASALRRPPKEDWYPAVRWLQQRYHSGDTVIAYPNEGSLPFDRAVRDLRLAIPSTPVPTAVPSLGIPGAVPVGNRGVVALPPNLIKAFAESLGVQRFGTIWLLRLGPESHDFGDTFLRELSAGRVEIGRWRRGAIDIVGLRRTE